MTYAAQEISAYAGEPVEIYLFRSGPAFQYAVTSASSAQTYNAITYQPEAISRSNVTQDTGEQPQLSQIVVPYDAPIALLFRAYLPAYPVFVNILRMHLTDTGTEWVRQFTGVVASVADDDSTAQTTLSCRPVGESLLRSIPWLTFQPTCNWATYSTGCGLDKNAFATASSVSTVGDTTIQGPVFATKPDGWFVNGWVERANGERRYIIGHVGDTLTLQSPFVGLAAGEDVTAYAGEDFTENTCKTKFNNIDRFLGFPRIPTVNPYNTNLVGQSNTNTGAPAAGSGTTTNFLANR